MSELQQMAQTAIAQKTAVLDPVASGLGGYSPIPHALFHKQLPELTAKYGSKQEARDALFLLMYLHAHANGSAQEDYYMWAFPSVARINADTGIHGDRIKPLCRILECEGLLITRMIPWRGHRKKLFLPLFYPDIEVNPAHKS